MHQTMRRKHVKQRNIALQESETKFSSNKERKTYLLRGNSSTVPSIIFCIVLALYTSSIYPSVPGGDSGELVIAARELGVAHPPGYPLFTMLAKLFQVIPFVSPVWSVGFMCACFGAATAAVLFSLLHRMTGSILSGVFTSSVFAFSQSTWMWSITAEVFSLNNFFIVSLLWVTIRFSEQCQEKGKYPGNILYTGCFICGVSLTNQHTMVVYVAFTSLWVISVLLKPRVMDISIFSKMVASFLVGLLPYIYLPISSIFSNARSTWGDHSSFSSFINHLLRIQYGSFQLAHGISAANFTNNIWAHSMHCLNNLTNTVVILAVIGAMVGQRATRLEFHQPIILWFAMMIGYSAFFAWLANLDPKDPLYYGVMERFWLQSDIIICVLAGLGLSSLLKKTKHCDVISSGFTSLLDSITGLKQYCVQFLAITVILFQVLRNIEVCNQSKNTVVRDFAMNLIQSLPNNSILVGKGDLTVNSVKYLTLCEGVRPDLRFVDVEMMTIPWYIHKIGRPFLSKQGVIFPGDKYHAIPGLHTDGKVGFNMKMFFDANKGQDIFTCIGLRSEDTSWINEYRLLPWGSCQRVVHMTDTFDLKDYINLHVDIYNWSLPYRLPDSHKRARETNFPWSSWERVANEEAWLARGRAAFYFLNMAEDMQKAERKNPQNNEIWMNKKKELFFAAYKGFKMIIENEYHKNRVTLGKPPYHTTPVPITWHKNLALAAARCHEMMPHEQNYALESVKHFTIYLKLTEAYNELDHEAQSIRNYIKHLEKIIPKLKEKT
ncbi:protein O-mannosyl-transferase TMEM260 [Ciona intestinalis]